MASGSRVRGNYYTIYGGAMGKVFTVEDVMENRIPELNNFRLVRDHMRRVLFADQSIDTAVIFGSVLTGTFDIRSDIDCFVAYHVEKQSDAMQTLQQLHEFGDSLLVPVNFVPADYTILATKMHLFGPLFRDNLHNAVGSGGLIKGSLDGLFDESVGPGEELEEYVRAKMYTLQESVTEIASASEEKKMRTLKKSLEAPMHVARKMLGARESICYGSKTEVLSGYARCAPRCLASQLSRLVDVDRAYTNEIKEQQKFPNEKKYLAKLADLEGRIPQTLEFIRGNILWLSEEPV